MTRNDTGPRSRTGHTTRYALVLAAVVLGASSCSIVMERQPHDVAPLSTSGVDLPTTVHPVNSSTVFLLTSADAGVRHLIGVPRDPTDSPKELLDRLLEGPTAAEIGRNGLTTAIPSGTSVKSPMVDVDGTLTIDVSGPLLSLDDHDLRDALAQIAFSVTALPSVRRLRILADGATRTWPTDLGESAASLTTLDFPDHAPRPGSTIPTIAAG